MPQYNYYTTTLFYTHITIYYYTILYYTTTLPYYYTPTPLHPHPHLHPVPNTLKRMHIHHLHYISSQKFRLNEPVVV